MSCFSCGSYRQFFLGRGFRAVYYGGGGEREAKRVGGKAWGLDVQTCSFCFFLCTLISAGFTIASELSASSCLVRFEIERQTDSRGPHLVRPIYMWCEDAAAVGLHVRIGAVMHRVFVSTYDFPRPGEK